MDNTSQSTEETNLRIMELSLKQKKELYNIELRKFALEFYRNIALPSKIEDYLEEAEEIYKWLKK